MSVETDDTGLVGLGDVGEDDVAHLDEHAILLRVACVFHDGWAGSALGERAGGEEVAAGGV